MQALHGGRTTAARRCDKERSGMSGFAGTFSYAYDAAGNPTGLTNPYGETTAWTYLNNGWLKTQQLHNNATTYTYDALARVTDLVTRAGPLVTDTLRSSFTGMSHDGAGNRTYLSASLPAHTAYSGNTSYTPDSKDRLTQESSTRAGGYTNNFTYDSAGNPTSFKGASRTYNSNNQHTANSYDAAGNPTTYGGATCTYDPENRLTAYGSVLTATYRGDGLRARKVSTAGTVYFLYDRDVLLAEMNSSGTVTAVNTWGAAGLVSRTNSSGTMYYTFDPQGSVAQRLDGTGAIQSNDVYDGHGAGATTRSGDVYGYKGQWGYYRDAESGLLLLTHRYYDPNSGRFLTRDPIGYSGGINVYSYCGNDPVGLIDPTGLMTKDEAWLRLAIQILTMVSGHAGVDLDDEPLGGKLPHESAVDWMQRRLKGGTRIPTVKNIGRPRGGRTPIWRGRGGGFRGGTGCALPWLDPLTFASELWDLAHGRPVKPPKLYWPPRLYDKNGKVIPIQEL